MECIDVRLRDELWLIERAAAATLIRMCEVDGADEFYRTLALDAPPLHVTLYARGSGRGIGLATAADLNCLGRQLSTDDSAQLLQQMRESPR